MNNYIELEELISSISITHEFKKNELIFLNTSDVLDGKILTNHYTKVSSLKGQAKKTIQNGDILYSEIRPKNRRYAYVQNLKNPEDYVVSTKLMVLRNQSPLLATDYLYHFLSSQSTVDYLQRKAENRIGSFPQITFNVLKKLKIRLIDICSQKKIAKVLSDLNAKIELNNKINAELEAMAKTLYDYWFVQFDFPDKDGKPYKSSGGKMVYNEKLKREIPEGWSDGVLSDIANITMGQSPAGSSYNEDGIGMVFYQGSTDFGLRFPTVRKYTTEPSRTAEPGDILLSVRAPVGTMNQSMEHCCIGRGLAALNGKKTSTSYLWSQMTYFKQIFDIKNSSGTTFGSITKDELYNLKVCIPNEGILNKFKLIADPLHLKIIINSKENQRLTELRDWLLPMLMNGQVTVKEQKTSANLPFYQMQLIGLSIQANKKDDILQGEMAIAKDMYLLDRLYGVKTQMEFVNHSWGPFAPEIKKRIKVKQYFGQEKFPNSQAKYYDVKNENLLLDKVNSVTKNQVYEAIQDINEKLFSKISKYKIAYIKELLATVLKCIEDTQSVELDKIREAMANWKIKKSEFKNKGEKFSEIKTQRMLQFIINQGWEEKVVN